MRADLQTPKADAVARIATRLPKRHVWGITMRNERQGFDKKMMVEAVGFSQAVTFAGDRLEAKGYSRYDFTATKIERGTVAS